MQFLMGFVQPNLPNFGFSLAPFFPDPFYYLLFTRFCYFSQPLASLALFGSQLSKYEHHPHARAGVPFYVDPDHW